MPLSVRQLLGDPVAAWRTGSGESQALTMAVMLAGVAACFVVSVVEYALMPLTSYYLWLLLGMLLLRFRQLVVLSTFTAAAAMAAVVADPPMTAPRLTACVTLLLSLGLILYSSSRQTSGLPAPLGEAMLTDLRDRLLSQGRVPELPQGWSAQSAMKAAHGGGYAGDFVVAELDEGRQVLELILVDVTGKGVPAATRALHFGGALAGLLGNLPPQGLMAAANDFLLRQDSDETFATGVHLLVELRTGAYHLTNAGHPPALHWSPERGSWETDEVRGAALGIIPHPDLPTSSGVLAPGEALMLYTDGVVETRDADLDAGVEWLRREAAQVVTGGFDDAAHRVLAEVAANDDDRAVVIVRRADAATDSSVSAPEHAGAG